MRRNAFWTRKGTPFREERQKRLASRSMAIGRKCTPRFDHGWKWREEKDRTSAPFFDLRKHSLPAFVFGAIRTEVLVRPTRFPRSGSGWFPNICSSIEAFHRNSDLGCFLWATKRHPSTPIQNSYGTSAPVSFSIRKIVIPPDEIRLAHEFLSRMRLSVHMGWMEP